MSKLPPRSTDLERKLVEAISPLPRLRDGFELIRRGKRDLPDDILPWLIWEYGLEEIQPYLKDPRRAIREGVIWQRQRGTKAALRTALGWIDFTPALIEETKPGRHWNEIQMDLGRVPESSELVRSVLALTELSAPARSPLVRVYHGYDVRRFVLDNSEWGDLLDGESGVFIDGVLQSFGRKQTYEARAGWSDRWTQAVVTRLHSLRVPYGDRALWDIWRFGEEAFTLNLRASRLRLSGFSSKNGVADPYPIGRHYRFSKSQIVLDDDGYKFGDTNFCFESYYTKEIGQTLVLDNDKLDDIVWGIEYVPIDERFDRLTSTTLKGPYTETAASRAFRETTRSVYVSRSPVATVLDDAPADRVNFMCARASDRAGRSAPNKRTWDGMNWRDRRSWRADHARAGVQHGSSGS